MKRISKLLAFFIIFLLIWSCQSIPVFSHGQLTDSSRKTYKFINGRWFDGKSFQRQTLYAVDGVLTKKKPVKVDETIDLADRFVVPPFAEAHNHNLGSAIYLNREFIRQMIQRYLAAGIFYVKIRRTTQKTRRHFAANLSIVLIRLMSASRTEF